MKLLFAIFFFIVSVASSLSAIAQNNSNFKTPQIRSAKLYRSGDQTSFPALNLYSADVLELHFDDLDNNITRNYYYTFQLCNSDWSPTMLNPFEYIKGFQQVRINTYRNSSVGSTRYVHYSANIPDRSTYPTRSGNYLLKVFLDGDTSKLAFTKRFVVVQSLATVAAQIQQPFNANLFRTGQKLNIAVQTDRRVQVFSPTDLKIVVLQNNNWVTSLYLDRPTITRGNYYEYNDEILTALPAGKEFRWVDLRSVRLRSDRMLDLRSIGDTTHVYMKPDAPRGGQAYIYYRDLNGSYTIETIDNVNPFWQTEYSYVHFSYFPSGNRAIEGNDLYLFGEMTDWGRDTSAKMIFNAERGAYEKTLYLKQGFYNYTYATLPQKGTGYPDFSQTEGDNWTTENAYTVLVYFRPFGNRADELIGMASLNSFFQRNGF